MFDSCLIKQNSVRTLFSDCKTKEDKYNKIMELGKLAQPLHPDFKTESNQVPGCQSTLYLHTFEKQGLIYFDAESNALISSGLAFLLTHVYSGESPETILKCPPDYLTDLEISSSLTPNRANGLYSIHLRMKQEALKFLLKQSCP